MILGHIALHLVTVSGLASGNQDIMKSEIINSELMPLVKPSRCWSVYKTLQKGPKNECRKNPLM